MTDTDDLREALGQALPGGGVESIRAGWDDTVSDLLAVVQPRLDTLTQEVAVTMGRRNETSAKVKSLLAVADRNGTRWCACSRADAMNEQWNPDCPHHGEGMRRQRDEARAALAAVRERAETPSAAVLFDVYNRANQGASWDQHHSAGLIAVWEHGARADREAGHRG